MRFASGKRPRQPARSERPPSGGQTTTGDVPPVAIAYARPTLISRASGRSAVACAAYRSGESLHDERQGKTHDYERRTGVLAAGILTPKDAPEWMRDRGKLWNAAERREDRSTRPNEAQLAREIVIALPHELDDTSREYLVKNILKEAATRKGMIADYAIHAPDREGDNRNYHAHVMLTMRTIDASDRDGFGKKARQWNSKQELAAFKSIIERETNRMLERHGSAERISFEREGREPTKHMGHEATQLERQGQPTAIGDLNRAIKERNRERGELSGLVAELRAVEAEREGLERGAQERGGKGWAVGKEDGAGQRGEVAPVAVSMEPPRQGAGVRTPEGAAMGAVDGLANVADRFMSAAADFLFGSTATPEEQRRAVSLDTAEGRREWLRQRQAAAERKAAIERMRVEQEAGRPIDARELAHLAAADMENIKARGEAAVLELIREEEQQRSRDRGRGGRQWER